MSPKGNHLRDYQQEIVTRVHREWNRHRSVMVQMPTGTGKTHVLASIVSAFSGSILIVAHRMELVMQIKATVDVFRAFDPLRMTQEVNVASIQSIVRRINKLNFRPDLVVIDEAHHALAKTYRRLWEKWPEAKFLGLTATPCRMNHAGFTDLFDTMVTSWTMAEFIRKGVLSAFDYVSIRPNSREQRLIDSLQKRGADGDFQVREMDAVLNKQPSIERLYRSLREFADGKKGIVYAISIEHARSIAEYYNRMGIRTTAIDSRTPQEERKRMVEAFKHGEIQVMVNVEVFSEGFDCPDVEFVQMARPTLSLAKYLQQVGRGLRKSQGKESCMMIDNVGLYRVFGLPIQAWDWESMFCGRLTGKGLREGATQYAASLATAIPMEAEPEDRGIGVVISHDSLLAKLHELDKTPLPPLRTAELKAWQDAGTGLWGLKRGREKKTEAMFVTIFDIKKGMAAVRFKNQTCGLVEGTGKTIWMQTNCRALRFERNDFLVATTANGKEAYLDRHNMKLYDWKPEIKRYGKFELLKVGHRCYSRTREPFASSTDYENMLITQRDFYLSIYEYPGNVHCILEGDNEECYSIFHRMEDGSIVISDKQGNFYHATKGKEKVYLGRKKSTLEWKECQERIGYLEEEIRKRIHTAEEEKKRKIQEEHLNAIPYQAGLKWGLKVGDRITVPPIYRNVKQPIGKYCAVEKNFCQWGIITIDGTMLIEPKYPNVSIEENGTALLTLVTGKTVSVRLKQ